MNNEQYSRNKGRYFTLDFGNFTERGLQNNLIRELNKNGYDVTDVVASNRITRKDGQPTKKAQLFIKGGQSVTITIGSEGDVILTKLNSTVIPMRQVDTLSKFTKELAGNIRKNQDRFDKAAERKAKRVIDKSAVKPATKTVAAQIVMAKEAQTAASDNISMLQDRVSELNTEISTATKELTSLKSDLDKGKTEESELIEQIESLGGEVV